MSRSELLARLLPAHALPLWVPLLTWYDDQAGVDAEAMVAHARSIRPVTGLWMLAGSTGDGWDLDDAQFDMLLDAALDETFVGIGGRALIGALRPDTEGVLGRIAQIHARLGTRSGGDPLAQLEIALERGVCGICVCPPVGEDVTQEEILEHYARVVEAASLPVAVYQLPQVTICGLWSGTFLELARRHEEIVLFKDSSGGDDIALATPPTAGPLLVRGAESRYADALRAAGGPYDGLLLSTGNSSAPALREIVARVFAGRSEEARTISDGFQRFWAEVFAAVESAPVGNAFSNANRSAVHLARAREHWRETPPPRLVDGSELPMPVLEAVAAVLRVWGQAPDTAG